MIQCALQDKPRKEGGMAGSIILEPKKVTLTFRGFVDLYTHTELAEWFMFKSGIRTDPIRFDYDHQAHTSTITLPENEAEVLRKKLVEVGFEDITGK